MIRANKQLVVCVLSFALLVGMISAAEVSAAKKVSLSTKKMTVTKGKSKTLKVKNTKKKVTWKILSGKKYITMKKKGKVAVTIKGKKKGNAKVQAKIGTKKMTATVIVINAKTATNTPVPTESKKPTKLSERTPTPSATTEPTNTGNPSNEPLNENDVTALKALIVEQRGRGATISEDIRNSDEYIWENGRLTGIMWATEWEDGGWGWTWRGRNLEGSISFSSLTALKTLNVIKNDLNALDVSGCVNLIDLECAGNKLNTLDVSKNTALTDLSCDDNNLTSLDVSRNTALRMLSKLEDLQCDSDVLVTGYNFK